MCVLFVYYVLLEGHYMTLIFFCLLGVCTCMSQHVYRGQRINLWSSFSFYLGSGDGTQLISYASASLSTEPSCQTRSGQLLWSKEDFPDHLLKFTLVTIICLNVPFSNFRMALINIWYFKLICLFNTKSFLLI